MSEVVVQLLADRPDLVGAVARIRWREWGRPPEPEELSWWEETTRQELGRAGLPVTFVAVDEHGQAVGAVGLGEFDIAERRDRSPWVLGMVVRTDRREAGVGRALLERLEAWAAGHGIAQAWVATGQAAGFYQRCGWSPTERLRRGSGQVMTVLTKRLAGKREVDPDPTSS